MQFLLIFCYSDHKRLTLVTPTISVDSWYEDVKAIDRNTWMRIAKASQLIMNLGYQCSQLVSYCSNKTISTQKTFKLRTLWNQFANWRKLQHLSCSRIKWRSIQHAQRTKFNYAMPKTVLAAVFLRRVNKQVTRLFSKIWMKFLHPTHHRWKRGDLRWVLVLINIHILNLQF